MIIEIIGRIISNVAGGIISNFLQRIFDNRRAKKIEMQLKGKESRLGTHKKGLDQLCKDIATNINKGNQKVHKASMPLKRS